MENGFEVIPVLNAWPWGVFTKKNFKIWAFSCTITILDLFRNYNICSSDYSIHMHSSHTPRHFATLTISSYKMTTQGVKRYLYMSECSCVTVTKNLKWIQYNNTYLTQKTWKQVAQRHSDINTIPISNTNEATANRMNPFEGRKLWHLSLHFF